MSDGNLSLASLSAEESGVVLSVSACGAKARRFQDLGIIPGTIVTCAQKKTAGGPAAYVFRGTAIALRNEDAALISVQVLNKNTIGQAPHWFVALAGNPNVGKSTIFNHLTGLRQHTGNWPGKTVASATGRYTHCGETYTLADIPGTYSLAANTADEEVARDIICGGSADAVVVVCDATCLERSLYLVLQILEVTRRVVVCVNLLDEAAKKCLAIDCDKLSSILCVPVVAASAAKTKGMEQLKAAAASVVRAGKDEPAIPAAIGGVSVSIVESAERIAKEVVSAGCEDTRFFDRKADRLLTGKWTAIPLMLLMLALIFWVTIVGSNVPSQALLAFFERVETVLLHALSAIEAPAWLRDALVSGIYRVLTWVVAVMLPPMAIFFPLFTLLEDLGVLPRVAFNLDSRFQKCGACGKQALTMCMGYGCNAVGVMGCRIIDSPRERLIAMLTNSLTPCNGRFPMLFTVSALFFAGMGLCGGFSVAFVVVFGVFMTFFASLLLSVTILKGQPSSFILELPPYRKPQILKVITRSVLDRTLFVLGRAATVAAPAGLIIWFLANTSVDGASLLSHLTALLDPLGRSVGLDGVILAAFLLGLPANEIVIPIMMMAYLSAGSMAEASSLFSLKQLLVQNGWTGCTAVCFLLFTLMHWPCGTTLWTIHKESGGLKWTALAFLLPTALGIAVCGAVNGLWMLLSRL